ncbi:hypothetical protein [Brevibacillus fulvus]|uniref:SbsA Ig-like domain-containing protein n=1 Tax=Brevibacillus fulvus TaxID=1125967 RepID=A0A939BS65_9BACL|nr:hypothetical protein [Brevibacillus fulvus]MBM7590148.1 hypothetical protein [Brevibacillus fulvus]
MNKKVAVSVLSSAVVASLATSAFAANVGTGIYIGGDVDRYYSYDALLSDDSQALFQEDIADMVTNLDKVVFVTPSGAATIDALLDGETYHEPTAADFEDNDYTAIKEDGTTGEKVNPVTDLGGDEPTGDLEVESVSAINASQIKIEFSDVVDKDSAELPANVTFDGFAGDTRELQEDGKTLIVTTNTPIKVKTDVVVTVKGVKLDADNTKVVSTFTKVISVEDTVKPDVATIVSKTNSATASSVDLTFTEPVKAAAVVKIDGAVAGTTVAGSKLTLSNLSLDASKTHTLEIVNLTDTADNVTSLVSKTFSITTDANAPQVVSLAAKGDHQILVTFNKEVTLASVQAAVGTKIKDELLADVNIDTITVATPGATDSDTQFIIPVKDKLYTTATSRTLTVVFNKDITDTLGNKSAAVTKTVTLTKDATAPAITSIQAKKAADGKTEAIIVNFSEGVLGQTDGFDEGKIRVLAPNGTDATANFFDTTQPAIADGATKATVKLKTATQLSGVYTFIIAKDAVSDLAETANTSAAFTSTIDFGTAPTGEFKIDPSDVKGSNNKDNKITVDYKQVVKGGAVAGSATDVSNYTLAGKALPQGTIITLSDDRMKAIIDLPDTEAISASDKAIFTISGVQNAAGTTITPVTTTVDVVDNTAPVLQSARVLDNKTVELTFSEALASVSNTSVGTEFTITQGGSELTLADSELVADPVSGFANKVKLTVKQGSDSPGTPAQDAQVGTVTPSGTGSATIGGTFNGTSDTNFVVKVTEVDANTGAVTKVAVSKDGGTNYGADINYTDGVDIGDGLTLTLSGTNAVNDTFSFTAKAAVAAVPGTTATTLDLTKDLVIKTLVPATGADVTDKAGNSQAANVTVNISK